MCVSGEKCERATGAYFRQEKCHLLTTVHVRALWQIIYVILHVDVLVEVGCINSTRLVKTAEGSGSG